MYLLMKYLIIIRSEIIVIGIHKFMLCNVIVRDDVFNFLEYSFHILYTKFCMICLKKTVVYWTLLYILFKKISVNHCTGILRRFSSTCLKCKKYRRLRVMFGVFHRDLNGKKLFFFNHINAKYYAKCWISDY